jgi:SAM-dependent methyltransferase
MSVPSPPTPAAVAFSRLAARYDEICENEIFDWMRGRVHGLCREAFPPGTDIIDIGCGSGIDAVFLRERGHAVLACDPAPAMIRETTGRLAARGLGDGALVLEADLAVLCNVLDSGAAALPARWRDATAGGILSNFGALNCAADLRPLGRLAARRLRGGGRLLLGLMSPWCALETAYFLARGRPGSAFRRLRGSPVLVEVEGMAVPTVYHRPRDVMRALGPEFVLRRTCGLAILVPPPHTLQTWRRLPRGMRRALMALDTRVSTVPAIAHVGDHFVMDIEKR